MAALREKVRPKRPRKKRRKVKRSGGSPTRLSIIGQWFLSEQLNGNVWLRQIERDERIVDEAYCQIIGIK